jgi:hypothetical protein
MSELGGNSSFVPLLRRLHDEVSSYSDAMRTLESWEQRYGFPAPGATDEALEDAQVAMTELAVTQAHIRAVQVHRQENFVLVPRGALSEVRCRRRPAAAALPPAVSHQPLRSARRRATACAADRRQSRARLRRRSRAR